MSAPRDPQDGGQYSPPAGYGHGQAPPYNTPLTRPRNGFGIAALVLGLLAVVLSWTVLGGIVLGLLALIFGLLGRARVGRGEATNGGQSIAGVVLGVIGGLIAIGLIALGMSMLNTPAGQSYQQCVQQAGDDWTKIQQCASEFGRQVGGA